MPCLIFGHYKRRRTSSVVAYLCVAGETVANKSLVVFWNISTCHVERLVPRFAFSYVVIHMNCVR
jgi:hypothetical protein